MITDHPCSADRFHQECSRLVCELGWQLLRFYGSSRDRQGPRQRIISNELGRTASVDPVEDKVSGRQLIKTDRMRVIHRQPTAKPHFPGNLPRGSRILSAQPAGKARSEISG